MYSRNGNKASVIYKQDAAFARFHLWILYHVWSSLNNCAWKKKSVCVDIYKEMRTVQLCL